jgi:hypothetical protein
MSDNVEANTFDILKEEPLPGDRIFKLEIGNTYHNPLLLVLTNHSQTDTPVIKTPSQIPSLVLFVTSVMLEYAHLDLEISSSMFARIKCQDDCMGERGARPEWAWEFWQNDWVFREASEVLGECVHCS